MHLKSGKYACKYALKTSKCALKNSKSSIINLETVKIKSVFTKGETYCYKMHMPKSLFQTCLIVLKISFEKKK